MIYKTKNKLEQDNMWSCIHIRFKLNVRAEIPAFKQLHNRTELERRLKSRMRTEEKKVEAQGHTPLNKLKLKICWKLRGT